MVSGAGGCRDGFKAGSRGWVQDGSGVVPEWFRSGSGEDAGEVPGGGYGNGGRPSDGDVRAGWFGAAGSGPGQGVYGFFGREVCLNHTVYC